MGHSTMLLVEAGILVVVVVLLLLILILKRSQNAKRKQGEVRQDIDSMPSGGEEPVMAAADEPPVAIPPVFPVQVEEESKEHTYTPAIEQASWLQEVVPEQVPPVVLQDLDATEAGFHLNEDQVVRMSAYDEIKKAPEEEEDVEPFDVTAKLLNRRFAQKTADDRQVWLQSRLTSPGVLGWFTLTPGGEAQYSDQAYDTDVYRHFARLLSQMIAASELVGMSDWKEFVVRGEEGIILMIKAPQSIMAKGDYVVVFLDEEKEVSNVIAQIGQVS